MFYTRRFVIWNLFSQDWKISDWLITIPYSTCPSSQIDLPMSVYLMFSLLDRSCAGCALSRAVGNWGWHCKGEKGFDDQRWEEKQMGQDVELVELASSLSYSTWPFFCQLLWSTRLTQETFWAFPEKSENLWPLKKEWINKNIGKNLQGNLKINNSIFYSNFPIAWNIAWIIVFSYFQTNHFMFA